MTDGRDRRSSPNDIEGQMTVVLSTALESYSRGQQAGIRRDKRISAEGQDRRQADGMN